MKIGKILWLGLLLLFCLALCACGSTEKDSGSRKDKITGSEESKDREITDKDRKDKDDKDDGSEAAEELLGKLKESLGVAQKDDNKDGTVTDNAGGADPDKNDGNDTSSDKGSDEYQGPLTDDSIDLSGLTSKHGRGYVYRLTGTEYYYEGKWEYTENDGYIHDGDTVMERTLTIYRYSNSTAIEYMLESAGEWGEYWHVEYNYPAKCTYFDYVEGGHVTVSGDTAVWQDGYDGTLKEIYTLQETYEFDE